MNPNKDFVVEARERFAAWVSDNDTLICGFENADLSSRDIGRRVCLSFAASLDGALIPGQSRGPEALRTKGMIPWQYILQLKTKDPEEAIRWLVRG
jgi:hypothetical protein